jgi:hypothetical protein
LFQKDEPRFSSRDFILFLTFFSEHGKEIQSNFIPGSVERSMDPDKRGIPQQGIPPIMKMSNLYWLAGIKQYCQRLYQNETNFF